MIDGGYAGSVRLVNPNYREIHGRGALPTSPLRALKKIE
jgi:hypothetical protein